MVKKMNNIFFVKGIYASGMVLQRSTVNCICGGGANAAQVNLEFRGKKCSTTADKNGDWKIEYNPGEAGGPFELKLVCGSDSVVFSDVYIGEVWLSSGQSNAQLPMGRMKYSYPEEFELPENPLLRIITIPINFSFDGEKTSVQKPEWKCANPANLAELSGTAYFFAKKLQKELGVPVGIINASQGGSPVFAWMNPDSFKELGRDDYIARIKKWNAKGAVKAKQEEVLATHKKWDTELVKSDIGLAQNWQETEDFVFAGGKGDGIKKGTFNIPGDFKELGKEAGVVWFKKELVLTKQQAEHLNSHKAFIWCGTIQDSDRVWINGVYCCETGYVYPPRRYEIPNGTLREGKNNITLRIQKNGPIPIRFFREKPYYIFSDDVRIHPVVFRNVERPEMLKQVQHDSVVQHDSSSQPEVGVKITLEGEWNYAVGCRAVPRPGEVFFEWEPSALYNSMLAPCFSYAIAGALWYQGESNAMEYYDYKALLMKMIELWRKKFVYAPEKMPFVVMQLPNWSEGFDAEESDRFVDWAELRDAQLKAVEETSNTALVSMIDAGEWNDLHPEKKKTGGTRAAMEALRIAYSGGNGEPKSAESSCLSAAPKIEYCERKDNVFTIRFNCGHSSLKAFAAVNAYENENDKALWFPLYADFTKDASTVYGFEFITKDGISIKASGTLVSPTSVEIISPEAPDNLSELRYLWKNNPWIVNLYSEELIPALPFKILL